MYNNYFIGKGHGNINVCKNLIIPVTFKITPLPIVLFSEEQILQNHITDREMVTEVVWGSWGDMIGDQRESLVIIHVSCSYMTSQSDLLIHLCISCVSTHKHRINIADRDWLQRAVVCWWITMYTVNYIQKVNSQTSCNTGSFSNRSF